MASSIINPSQPIVSDLVAVSAVDESKTAAAVWSYKPVNAVAQESASSYVVMDSGLWPSLGDSAKPALKVASLQEVTENSLNKPAVSMENNDSTATTSAANNVEPSEQSSANREDGGSSGADVASNGIVTSGKPLVTVAADSVLKDQRDSSRGNNQQYHRGSYRRGGNGSYYPRGGKVHQGRGNQEWNHVRNVQPHRGGYVRPPIYSTPPVIPPMNMPMRPFANNPVYPDGSVYFPGPRPMVAGPMFFPIVDPVLSVKIYNQINYYFSNDNLAKDLFLRRSMDEEGWVSVNLIAGFNKVASMTDNVPLILHVMRSSDVVEVQGDKMRRRNDWAKWLLPAVGQDSVVAQIMGLSSSRSSSSSSGESQQAGGGE